MSMTKKDYELVAGSLRCSLEWNKKLAKDHHRIICENMANALQRNNKDFKRDLFLKQCGVEI